MSAPAKNDVESAIDVRGSLHFSCGDRTVDVIAHGSVLDAEVGESNVGFAIFKRFGLAFKLMPRIARELNERGLRLRFTRHGHLLAELGHDVEGGPLMRMLGLSRLRVAKRWGRRT